MHMLHGSYLGCACFISCCARFISCCARHISCCARFTSCCARFLRLLHREDLSGFGRLDCLCAMHPSTTKLSDDDAAFATAPEQPKGQKRWRNAYGCFGIRRVVGRSAVCGDLSLPAKLHEPGVLAQRNEEGFLAEGNIVSELWDPHRPEIVRPHLHVCRLPLRSEGRIPHVLFEMDSRRDVAVKQVGCRKSAPRKQEGDKFVAKQQGAHKCILPTICLLMSASGHVIRGDSELA